MVPRKAMILAAGLGTRLKPFTFLRPKPLFPVLDRPLLLIIIGQLRQAGFHTIIVNAHHLSEQIMALLYGEKDIILQQEELIMGTGGGLRLALDNFDNEPVLITNGDIYHTLDLAWVYQQHCISGFKATLILHDYPRFNNVEVTDDGSIRGFCERIYNGEEIDGKGKIFKKLAFTGIHVIDPALLEMIPPRKFCNIIDFYKIWIQEAGVVQALVVKGHFWRDIGTLSDYLDLHAALLLKRGEHGQSVCSAGVKSPFFISNSAVIGRDVHLTDWVSVGGNVRVGDGVSLKRVVVWDGVEIVDGSSFCDAIVV